MVLNQKRQKINKTTSEPKNEIHCFLLYSLCISTRLEVGSLQLLTLLISSTSSLRLFQECDKHQRVQNIVLHKRLGVTSSLKFDSPSQTQSCIMLFKSSFIKSTVTSISSLSLFCQWKIKILKHQEIKHINYEQIQELI